MRTDRIIDGYIGETPENFDKAIDKALANLPKRRRMNRAAKAVAAVAAAAMVVLGAAAASPEIANALGLGNVFEWHQSKAVENNVPEDMQRHKVVAENAQPVPSQAGQESAAVHLDMGGHGAVDVEITEYYFDGRQLSIGYKVHGKPVYLYGDDGEQIGYIEIIASIWDADGEQPMLGECSPASPTENGMADGVQMGYVSAKFDEKTDIQRVKLRFTAEKDNLIELTPKQEENWVRTVAEGWAELDIVAKHSDIKKAEISEAYRLGLFDMSIDAIELLPTETLMRFSLLNIDIEGLKPYTQDGKYPPCLMYHTGDGNWRIATKWVDTYEEESVPLIECTMPILEEMPERFYFQWVPEEGDDPITDVFEVDTGQ